MTRHLLLFVVLVAAIASVFGQQSDAALRRVRELDAVSRDTSGKLQTLTAAEHLSRAETYSSNRLFPEAREHWSKVFENYPSDAGIPKALFGTARSYMWERKYADAVDWFEKLTKDHLNTKDGREGLAFKGASYVRLGKNLEAAKAYEQYVTMFPQGERIESAYLNIIDAYREARKYDEANKWVDRTVVQFPGKPSEVNALHARLRMEIFRENWNAAVEAANLLLSGRKFTGAMTGSDEVKYLKAFALDRAKKTSESLAIYRTIPERSYFGSLAEKRISGSSDSDGPSSAPYAEFPVMYRTELLREATKRNVDPRFLLAIMKQESSFKPAAKSPAGARGLLQLVYDTAIKYNKKAGYPNLQPDDLYKPAVSIAIGSQYVAELKDEFGGLYEAIAASYNGGEDNSARWLKRSRPKDAGIFASEVGFAETKNYVFKVMNNYRVYRELYTEDLQRK
ncbi:MAG: transglycosylase SLT domain-containing protein [Pyrinomonadaceae bacterium]